MKVGYVALVGRPNVGKSTLLNRLIGQKISITSRRPQTTRHRILGIKTTDQGQAIYVDTPGIHTGGKKALNRYLNRTADSALAAVDVVLWVTDRVDDLSEEEPLLQRLATVSVPVILVVNKIDRLDRKTALLPFLQTAAQRYPFAAIVPVSGLRSIQLDRLETEIFRLLPEGEPLYPEDQVTDRPMRFIAAEIVREKLLRYLGQEVPHALTVGIESFKTKGRLTRIDAIIWVEREGQKAIVIGQQGELLKKVGQQAREELEKLLETRVYLSLWVKVKEDWSNNEQALRSFGYGD